jgi:hypothetical protein
MKNVPPKTSVRSRIKGRRPARTEASERCRAIDKIFDELLREGPSKISVARLLEESRR